MKRKSKEKEEIVLTEEQNLESKKEESAIKKETISDTKDKKVDNESGTVKKLTTEMTLAFKRFLFGEKKETKKVNSTNIQKDIPNNIERYNPDITKGLNVTQVNTRIEENLTNKDENTNSQTISKIFFKNIFTFFNVLELCIFILLIVFQLYTQTIFFAIIVLNTGIGIAQEIKSKKTIDKLKLVNMQSVNVIRDSQTISLSSNDLVLDDIYLLKTGDEIPTDSTIKEGSIEVNESLLTGESLPIKKNVGDQILAGSFIVSGACIVQASRIGKYNYANGIQSKVKEVDKPQSELTKSLNAIIKVISIIIIPLGCTLFATQWASFWNNSNGDVFHAIQSNFERTAGSIIGMIPAGMYLLTSVALAVGAMSLAKKHTLVQDLYCIEMLARVNTLCLDKTGTLTDGTMKVSEVKVLNNKIDLDKTIGSFLASFKESNQTSAAIALKYPLKMEYEALKVLPFSSKRKLSAVTFKDNIGTFILGAPEYVLEDYESDEMLSKYIKDYQKKGFRLVIFAQASKELQGEDLQIVGKVKPICIFALEDHIREEAPSTIEWFKKNDVQIKIISGDDPLTASEIARKCSVENAEKCISLKGMSFNEISEIIDDYVVFGRVTPEQKAYIIEKLKDNGRTVGMTGDGVNDILAMKSADCSIAMANGSSASKNVAHLVLLDSNFASMPSIVKEGRRVINNIQRSSSLFLMKTIFTILFTIICICINITYPFSTNNILIFETVGIGLPSFFLALQPNDQIIKGNFLKNTFARAIPAALCLFFAISLNYLFKFCNILDLNSNSTYANFQFTSFNGLTMSILALVMVYNCSYPLNRYRSTLYLSLWAIMLLLVFVMPSIPSIGSPNTLDYINFQKIYGLPELTFSYNLSLQFTGLDFRFLTKTMWLLLIIYMFSISLLLNILNQFFVRMDREMTIKKSDFLNFKE